MSDLQSKVGDGLTKIQGSLQTGKQKLQTAQEMGQLRKRSSEAAAKRMESIVALGEEVYNLMRKGEILLPTLTGHVEGIQAHDRVIYEVNQTLAAMNAKPADTSKCQCGAPLQPTDKFCGSCGQKVQIPDATTEQAFTLQCPTCTEMIPSGSAYCGCCGHKIQV
ncbi:hypothetical protein A374_06611 [Fictibacillus macauensis ZFHKF-1]|uniref:DZANK-type domain-containing protein n=1 Tax=Fictibacillus macauensis ZFHKF-1 TaxID=1196324 RepID=I8UH72_9BACL|nr:zinc ribbon domain-containing protein [Fictibacillus macauensis]EIT86250.1 hypothetical protein A374_06611 [Fictibacillus macauensis ZFHKF-1]